MSAAAMSPLTAVATSLDAAAAPTEGDDACCDDPFELLGIAPPSTFGVPAPAGLLRFALDPAVQLSWLEASRRTVAGAPTDPSTLARQSRYRQFMAALTEHAGRFTVFHQTKRLLLARVSRGIRARVAEGEKDREREGAKEEKARLAALKSNDMAAYAALVQKTKNERLTFLLEQTDKYLKSMAELVTKQQAAAELANADALARAAKEAAEKAARENARAKKAAERAAVKAAKEKAHAEAVAARAVERARLRKEAAEARRAAKKAAAAAAAGGGVAVSAGADGAEAAAGAAQVASATGAPAVSGSGGGSAAGLAAAGSSEDVAMRPATAAVAPPTTTTAVVAPAAAAVATPLPVAGGGAGVVAPTVPAGAAAPTADADADEDDDDDYDDLSDEDDDGLMMADGGAGGGEGEDDADAGDDEEEDEEEAMLERERRRIGSGEAATAAIEGGLMSASSSASHPVAKPLTGDVLEDYYRVAHRISERVKTQPRILSGGALKPYQLAGLEWMVSLYNNRLNGILADEMGLGKTVQTVSLIAYLMEVKGNKGPFMVTVPLSTLSNWANEFTRWAPSIVVVQYKGTPGGRKEIYDTQIAGGAKPFNVLLTTYDYTMKDKAKLRRIHWQYIIIDEGHRLKNAQARFTQVLGQEYSSRNRLLLTGTPLQNSLPELWSLLNFLLPTVFSSVDSFEQWFSKPFASYKSSKDGGASGGGDGADDDDMGALTREETMVVIQRLHQVLRPFLLRRLKSQVLQQLPSKTEHVIRCELSAWQRHLYTQIQRYGGVALEPGTSGASAAQHSMKGLNGALLQLRKVCNHPYLFRDSYNINDDMWRCSAKFELLDRMLPKLKAAGHRVLIFSQMTTLLDVLGDYLDYRQHRFLRLDGSTSAADREERMVQFNAHDSPYFAFLLSTRAGGLGINLATADTVILFDSDWNPTADAQAQDRAHRIGQTREVRVFRLATATPLEDRVLSRAADKATMEALVIEAGQFSNDAGGASGGAGGGGDGSQGKDKRKLLEDLLAAELDPPAPTASAAVPAASSSSAAGGAAMGDGDSVGDGDGSSSSSSSAAAGGAGASGVDKPERAGPDDEDLNQMLARGEDEMALFASIDAQRYAREAHLFGPVGATRLMPEAEVPAWVRIPPTTARNVMAAKTTQTGSGVGGIIAHSAPKTGGMASWGLAGAPEEEEDDEAVVVEDADDAGGRRRARAAAGGPSYAEDTLTEAEFMDLAEEAGDDPDALQAAIRKRVEEHRIQREQVDAKKAARKAKAAASAAAAIAAEEAEEDGDKPPPAKKARSRPSKGGSTAKRRSKGAAAADGDSGDDAGGADSTPLLGEGDAAGGAAASSTGIKMKLKRRASGTDDAATAAAATGEHVVDETGSSATAVPSTSAKVRLRLSSKSAAAAGAQVGAEGSSAPAVAGRKRKRPAASGSRRAASAGTDDDDDEVEVEDE